MPIEYVFVLMQENHSFDNYYGRFQDYLKDVLHRTDARTRKYTGQESPDGIDVPGKPFQLLDSCHKAQQDKKLDSSYDPRVDAPFNPTVAGKDPPDSGSKHYWTHANGDADQCVSDTCHEWWCTHMAWDSGRMDGFFEGNAGYFEGGEPKADPFLGGDRAMLYYDQTDIPYYYWLADEFALGDHYFSSMLGPTWPNRDYLYGATSRGLVANGSAEYGGSATVSGQYVKDVLASPPALNGLATIYDAVTAAGVHYTQWVRDRYANVIAPARWSTWYGKDGLVSGKKFTYDNQSFGGKGFEAYVHDENQALASAKDPNAITHSLDPVNFLDTSSLEDVNGEDEHPPAVPQMGQRFSYDVVRVLLNNPEVWKRSVLIITYDEGGGFYDHVDPPKACTPDNIDPSYVGGKYGTGPHGDATDALYGGHFNRYGIRVPLLVVSPWVKHQYVSHYTYDHTSIVRFIEAKFGLAALTRRDANADPLLDFFDFSSASEKLAGRVPGWGTEQLPDQFNETPSDKLSVPSFAAADTIAFYGGPRGDLYTMKAPKVCRDRFPPADSPSEVLNVLGKDPYDSYKWSDGKRPPDGYDPEASHPFPIGSGPGGPDPCMSGGPVRVKVITTVSQSPNDAIADPLFDVHVLIGGTRVEIPSNDDVARTTVSPGTYVIKFPKDNGLDDPDGGPLFRVGFVGVHPTDDRSPMRTCRPTDQEGDVAAALNTTGDPNSQSDYEVGVRIVPFGAEQLDGGVTCP